MDKTKWPRYPSLGFIFGQASQADIMIAHNECRHISQSHFVVKVIEGSDANAFELQCQNMSSNGTKYKRGKHKNRVVGDGDQPLRLLSGDILYAGDAVLRVDIATRPRAGGSATFDRFLAALLRNA